MPALPWKPSKKTSWKLLLTTRDFISFIWWVWSRFTLRTKEWKRIIFWIYWKKCQAAILRSIWQGLVLLIRSINYSKSYKNHKKQVYLVLLTKYSKTIKSRKTFLQSTSNHLKWLLQHKWSKYIQEKYAKHSIILTT